MSSFYSHRMKRRSAGWLIVFAFLFGTVAPFLGSSTSRTAAAPQTTAEIQDLGLAYGQSAQDFLSSFCQHSDDGAQDPAHRQDVPSGKQNCPVCQALHDTQTAPPPNWLNALPVPLEIKEARLHGYFGLRRFQLTHKARARAPPASIEVRIA